MAKQNKKPVVIQYRRLEDVTLAFRGTTLEKEVRRALAAKQANATLALKDDFRLRVWSPPSGDSLFLNQNQDGGPYMFGDLVHFTQGHMQALYEHVKTAAPSASIKQMRAQNGEFIHSMLFWYIRGNHVFVLQGRTARTAELEIYLSWLLAELAKTMPAPLNIILRSKFTPEAIGGTLQEIEEINIGGTLRQSERTTVVPEVETKTRVVEEEHQAREFKAGGRSLVRDVINAITGGDTTSDDFLNKMDPKAELTVRVTIGYKAKRVRVDSKPLRDLEVGLRNIPDAEVSVKGHGGKMTPLGELQLSYKTTVDVKDSLWSPESVLQAFNRAYLEWTESGRIDDLEDENPDA